MLNRICLVLLLLVICGVQLESQVEADTAKAAALVKQAYQLAEENQYDTAIALSTQAASIYRRASTPEWLGKTQLRIIDYLIRSVQYEAASDSMQKYQIELTSILGSDHILLSELHFYHGELLRSNSQFVEARNAYQRALQLRKQHVASDIIIGKCLARLGDVARTMGEHEKAMEYYIDAIKILQDHEGPESVLAAQVMADMAILHRFAGEYQKAVKTYEEAERIMLLTLDPEAQSLSSIHNGLGIIHAQNGRYPQALLHFNKLLNIDKKTLGTSHPYLASTYTNLGILHELMGDLKTALSLHEDALAIKRKSLDENNLSLRHDYASLAVINSQLGDYEEAQVFAEKALQIELDNIGDKSPNVANSYNLVAQTLSYQRQYDLSIQQCRLGLNVLGGLGSTAPEAGPLYHNMARNFLALEILDSAEWAINRALEINTLNFGSKHPNISTNNIILADIYEQQGQLELAGPLFEASIPIAIEAFGANHSSVATLYGELAWLKARTGDFEEATNLVQKGISTFAHDKELNIAQIPDFDELTDPRAAAHILLIKSKILNLQYQSDRDPLLLSISYDHLIAIIELLDQVTRTYKSDISAGILREDFDEAYEFCLWTCHELYTQTQDPQYIEQAFYTLEKSKANQLLNALYRSKAESFSGIPTLALEREKEIERDLRFFQQKLTDARQENMELDTIQGTIFTLKTQYDSLVNSFESQYPEYYRLKHNQGIVDLETIQQTLDEQEIIVEYFLGVETIYTLCISSDTFQLIRSSTSGNLDESINRIRMLIAGKSPDLNALQNTSSELFTDLLGSITSLDQHEKIIIVPDKTLGYLPFELLRDPENPEQNYLIQSHEVSYMPSATFLMEVQAQDVKSDSRYLAFAPSFSPSDSRTKDFAVDRRGEAGSLAELAGAFEEVEILSSMFEGESLKQENASEYQFKQKAGGYDVIHLATHAIIDDINPMKSRLLFSSEKDTLEDGNLHAYELFNLDLSANMAVLSACNTGFGKVHKGEGVQSLGRAFAYAGCPSIVMSLWPAPDEATSEIMKVFYAELAKGSSKDAALRTAKLAFLENQPDFLLHPFYWAGFIVQGNTDPIFRRPMGTMTWILLGLGSVLSFLLIRKVLSRQESTI